MGRMEYPPSIKSLDGNRKIELNESPSVALTNNWMVGLGCEKVVAGKTFQGRDIVLYWIDVSLTDFESLKFLKKRGRKVGRINSKNVLFLSLVHGNEPMGLTSLLMGAKELAEISKKNIEEGTSTIRVYFIPIVNVDAYEANMALGENYEERGCHRPNLRPTCNNESFINMIKRETASEDDNNTSTTIPIATCASRRTSGYGGIDLNRNFPFDWQQGNNQICSYNNPGPHPLSEPESQTIAKVVQDYNITAAMSLHSRASYGHQALLIHPYTSDRSFDLMNTADARRFRDWSHSMKRNSNGNYETGTAREAIKYTASGCTIDWMHGYQQVVSFVLEAVPPCYIRWCEGEEVYRSSQPNADTMVHFVKLALFKKDYDETMHVFPILFLTMIVSGIFYFSAKQRHKCRLLLYRFGLPVLSKDKDEMTQDEKVELTPAPKSQSKFSLQIRSPTIERQF